LDVELAERDDAAEENHHEQHHHRDALLERKGDDPVHDVAFGPTDLLRARRHAIDEETALGDHAIAGSKALDHLDHVAIVESDLDPPQLDRFFAVLVAHHPDAGGFA